MKVLHVITNLGMGGAETVLCRLIAATSPTIEHTVVSLMGAGYYGPRLRAAGINVQTLDMPRGRLTLGGLLKLRRIVFSTAPDVVQTWMYHADLVGGLTARCAGVEAVVWGIRNSNLDLIKSNFATRSIAKICALLSNWIPAAIVCCAEQAARVHQDVGYRAEKFTVIPNGYDLSRFVPDVEAREKLRLQWNIQPDQILLGMVARWDPQKDHDNLLRSLGQLKDKGMIFRCVLVGTGMDRNNNMLLGKVERLGLSKWIILAGPRDDIPAVMNSLDVHVLSSAYGEAFPNAVAEAMACGTPCVVTDVGDAALIVGDTGWVVQPQDAEALAKGIQKALTTLNSKVRTELGRGCRSQIEDNFSLDRMVKAYLALWERVANSKAVIA